MEYAFPARKLDLMLHLVANLPHPVVLRGAERSGKTQLLRQFQAHAQSNWLVCYLQAGPNLTFDFIVDEALRLLRRPGDGYGSSQAELLEEQLVDMERHGRCLVFVLDNAGALMPGLLESLVRYVSLQPPLKLVCALTPEEFAAKTLTDPTAFKTAQILPLTTEAGPLASPSAASVGLVVPPPAPVAPGSPPSSRKSSTYVLSGLVAVLLAAVLYDRGGEILAAMQARLAKVGDIGSEQTHPMPLPPDQTQAAQPIPEPPVTEPPPLPVEPPMAQVVAPEQPAVAEAPPSADIPVSAQAAPEVAQELVGPPMPPGPPTAATDGSPPVASQGATSPAVAAGEPAVVAAQPVSTPTPQAVEPAPAAPATPAPSPTPAAVAPTAPPKPPAAAGKPNNLADLKDAEWLQQQDAKGFTLQLITVSQPARLNAFLRDFPPSDQIALYKTGRSGGDLYTVVYGIYPSFGAALAAAAELPSRQGRAVPRPLRAVQQEILKTKARDEAAESDKPQN